jgi:hypothetical protein
VNKKADLVSNFYSSIYLTFISLLQGIALVLLLPEFIVFLRTTDHPFTDFNILPFVLTLLIVFTIWHHYTFQVLYLKWFPNISDAILPFLIAISEFFLISYATTKTPGSGVDVDGWIRAFAAFLFLTGIAYFGILRNDIDLFSNIMTRKNAIRHDHHNRTIGKILGCFMILQALAALAMRWWHAERWLWLSLFLFVVHIAFTEYYVMTRIKPFFIKAIEEFEEREKLHWRRPIH